MMQIQAKRSLTFEPVDLLLELLDGLLGELGAGFGFLQFHRQGLQLALEFLDSLVGLKISCILNPYPESVLNPRSR